MNQTVDDLTIQEEEGGRETIKELDKQVLSQGAWSTIVYQYQEWDEKNQDHGPVKFTIRRYQKRNGVYNQRSKFNISSCDQARKMCNILEQWLSKLEDNHS